MDFRDRLLWADPNPLMLRDIIEHYERSNVGGFALRTRFITNLSTLVIEALLVGVGLIGGF